MHDCRACPGPRSKTAELSRSSVSPNGHSACPLTANLGGNEGKIAKRLAGTDSRSRGGSMSDDLRSKGVKNEVTGAAKEAEGKIRDAAADITGDDSENLKAKGKTLEGKIQKNFGKAQQDADDDRE